MMGGSSNLGRCLMFLLSCAFMLCAKSLPSSSQPKCKEDERSALFEFRRSFSTVCDDPMVAMWDAGGNNGSSGSNCCMWDGVDCDEDTGHVVSLDLSWSCLRGILSATNSLFRLVYLKSLNLAHNDFYGSEIPPKISRFHDLRSLDLSYSNLTGQIPKEVTRLYKLSTLDLSYNSRLLLHNPSLKDIALNLTNLRELHLREVDISSAVPTAIANMSSLKTLSLAYTGLHSRFPNSIFHMPYLENLHLNWNENLTGSLPEFSLEHPLEELILTQTRFSGHLPSSIGNLQSMNILNLNSCSFEGPIPSSFGHLRRLTFLDLNGNKIRGDVTSSLRNLTRLEYLDLSGKSINIQPSSPYSSHWLSKLTELTHLSIPSLNYTGQFPPSIANLTKLRKLEASNNELVGSVSSTLMNLTRLEFVALGNNKRLTANFDTFLNLKHLYLLYLDGFESILFSHQNYTEQASPVTNSSDVTKLKPSILEQPYPKFQFLSLNNCNLTEIPQFLKHQDELVSLGLANNQIDGKIPQWLLKVSNESLSNLDLSSNLLTGFENLGQTIQSYNIRTLDLSDNMLQGPFPPISFINMQYYVVSNNSLTGDIPRSICNSSSLKWLDLSNNNFTGKISPCIFGVLAGSMTFLSLGGNNLYGSIPRNFSTSCQLQLIELSRNRLEGELPRSLVNCKKLRLINVGRNHINDTFPSWLGNLQGLQALILHYNNFHGPIGAPKSSMEFPNLHIISLSHNSHTGCLPIEYIQSWLAMKTADQDQSRYSGLTDDEMSFSDYVQIETGSLKKDKIESSFSVTIANKGTERSYLKILNDFKVIDLSSNKFHGEITDTIGNLKGLKELNFSNNNLTGAIPSSLANIARLESLDLSLNKLSGEIPEELTELNFLAFFNVSHNHLVGRIPQGKQFFTFDNNSFLGNQLCGDPLSNKCGAVDDPSSSSLPPSSQDKSDGDSMLVHWIIRLLGCASGLIIGYVVGNATITYRHLQWLVDKFGRRIVS